MPKATVATPSGAKITVEGTSEEVFALIARLEGLDSGARPRQAAASRSNSPAKSKPSLPGLITEMISNGFFKEPKLLSVVKDALEQNGQFYPLTTLSPAMLRLIRSRQLRRIKDKNGRWSYVG
jgi:hypothetical protein